MKTHAYYSAVIVFMMFVTMVTLTLDKSIVEKFISPLSPHGASAPLDSGIVRSFQVSSTTSLWGVSLCEEANQAIAHKPIGELEVMTDEQLSDFVNRANSRC
jgi:hypothetical protein